MPRNTNGIEMPEFSETLMDYFQTPRNQGKMYAPHCIGIAGVPGQGRYIQLFLRIVSGRVERMQFDSYGCGVTIAACSVLTEMVEGRPKEECSAIQPDDIAVALDGIPQHKMDSAHFAILALKNALVKWPSQEEASTVRSKTK